MLTRNTFNTLLAEAQEQLSTALGPDRVNLNEQIHLCTNALQLMEQLDLDTVPQLGPFGSKPLTKGMKVRVRKGTPIRTTDPRHGHANPKIAAKDYEVILTYVYGGHIDHAWHPHKAASAFTNQHVEWVGSGGYWYRADSQHVDALPIAT